MNPADLRTSKNAKAIGVDDKDKIIVVTIPDGYRLIARVESGRLDVVPLGAPPHVREFQLVPIEHADGKGPDMALALVRKRDLEKPEHAPKASEPAAPEKRSKLAQIVDILVPR